MVVRFNSQFVPNGVADGNQNPKIASESEERFVRRSRKSRRATVLPDAGVRGSRGRSHQPLSQASCKSSWAPRACRRSQPVCGMQHAALICCSVSFVKLDCCERVGSSARKSDWHWLISIGRLSNKFPHTFTDTVILAPIVKHASCTPRTPSLLPSLCLSEH